MLAHAAVGHRGRWVTNSLLVLSAALGYIAGFNGLAGLVSKVWISVIALAAGLSTTLAILALTMLKSGEHMRASAKYENIHLRILSCDASTPEGRALFSELWVEFRDFVP
jgi:hypothetical protein